ncbi:hypothetical protein [Nostoc sp.]
MSNIPNFLAFGKNPLLPEALFAIALLLKSVTCCGLIAFVSYVISTVP